MMPDVAIDHVVLVTIEVAGTLAFAVSGFMAAARKRMDIVGVSAVSFFAAFGGGTLVETDYGAANHTADSSSYAADDLGGGGDSGDPG